MRTAELRCHRLYGAIQNCIRQMEGTNSPEQANALERILLAFRNEREVIPGLNEDRLYWQLPADR